MSNDWFIVLVIAAAAIGSAAVIAQSPSKEPGSAAATVTTAAEDIAAATTTSVVTVTAPIAITRDASAIAASTATLHGTVDMHGVRGRYWFEYSSDPLLGAILVRTTPPIPLETDAGKIEVETDVFGLSPHMTYYFRVVAATSAGTVRGSRGSFRTK